jgi:tRNA (mo5U34)-methyltransferase
MPTEDGRVDGFYEKLSRDELLGIASKLHWMHSIDLGDGFVTTGQWPLPNAQQQEALAKIDFRGSKVLDIGCWDGWYSFEAERLGASQVYATDLLNQRAYSDQPTFLVAHAARKSNVRYFPNLSVHDIETLGVSDFDVVLFSGVYYHLKDPLRALAMLRRVMKDGACLYVEGAVLNEPGCYAAFHYREPYCGDYSNWWVPTRTCLRQWIESSYFDVDKEYGPWGDSTADIWRTALLAKAVRGPNPFHRLVDELLGEFSAPV